MSELLASFASIVAIPFGCISESWPFPSLQCITLVLLKLQSSWIKYNRKGSCDWPYCMGHMLQHVLCVNILDESAA